MDAKLKQLTKDAEDLRDGLETKGFDAVFMLRYTETRKERDVAKRVAPLVMTRGWQQAELMLFAAHLLQIAGEGYDPDAVYDERWSACCRRLSAEIFSITGANGPRGRRNRSESRRRFISIRHGQSETGTRGRNLRERT